MSFVEIPGDGARPALLAGDRVAVVKTAYGLRLWPMRRWGYVRWGEGRPERGEWLAFNDPSVDGDSLWADECPVFVGCVYALPGDSLWVDSLGGVYRRRPSDGRRCRTVELPRRNAYVAITPDNIRWYARMISLHEGAYATVVSDSLCVSGHFVPSFRFSHDYYWVSGGGADSRSFGFVPDTHLMGRLSRVIWSWDAAAPWYARFRFGRLMKKVEEEPS